MKWNSVKERLPTPGERLLLIMESEDGKDHWLALGVLKEDGDKQLRFFEDVDSPLVDPIIEPVAWAYEAMVIGWWS